MAKFIALATFRRAQSGVSDVASASESIHAESRRYQVFMYQGGLSMEIVRKADQATLFLHGDDALALEKELDLAVQVAEQRPNSVIPNAELACDLVCELRPRARNAGAGNHHGHRPVPGRPR